MEVHPISFSPMHSQTHESRNNTYHASTPQSTVTHQNITAAVPPQVQRNGAPRAEAPPGNQPTGSNGPGPAATTKLSPQAQAAAQPLPSAPSTASEPPPSPAGHSYTATGAPSSSGVSTPEENHMNLHA